MKPFVTATPFVAPPKRANLYEIGGEQYVAGVMDERAGRDYGIAATMIGPWIDMAGRVPAIQAAPLQQTFQRVARPPDVDGRNKPGHDGCG